MRRVLLLAATLLGGCESFESLYQSCVDAGRCETPGGGDSGPTDAGTGHLTLAPASHDYGAVALGASTVRTFTARNGTSTPLLINATASPAQYTNENDGCSGMLLQAGRDCTVDVRFTPTAGPTVAGLLTVNGGAGESPTATLNGSGIVDTVRFELQPATLVLDETEVGVSSSKPVQLINTGVALSGLTFTSDAGDISASGCSTLDADASCQVTVTFMPAQTGSRRGTVTASAAGVARTLEASGAAYRRLPLDVVFSGRGRAHVTSQPAGLACPPSCTMLVRDPGSVQLSVSLDNPRARFAGWDGGGCSGDGGCTVRIDGGPVVVEARLDQDQVMFITSARVPAPIHAPPSGTAQAIADGVCAAFGSDAGLAGPFVAWLSELDGAGSPVGAIERLRPYRGWVRPDGRAFADRADDIAAGRIIHPPFITERGTQVPAWGDFVVVNMHNDRYLAWTGTSLDGGYAGAISQCASWTSSATNVAVTVGAPWSGGGGWTNSLLLSGGNTLPPCNHVGAYYCFETAVQRQVRVISPSLRRRAFLSRTRVDGLVDAGTVNQICNDEALDAGLDAMPQFLALRSNSGTAAVSSLRLDAGTWVRVDGVPLFDDASGLAGDAGFLVPLNVFADGTALLGTASPTTTDAIEVAVWTGAQVPSMPGNTNDTCNNWTSTSLMLTTSIGGNALSAGPECYRNQNAAIICVDTMFPMSGRARLYCFER